MNYNNVECAIRDSIQGEIDSDNEYEYSIKTLSKKEFCLKYGLNESEYKGDNE